MGSYSPTEAREVRTAVPLKYVARAGLLPELTRQTYDSLYKALREAILNSVDAGANRIIVDFSNVQGERTLEIADDGVGMSMNELQQSFMSLGGSKKLAAEDKFGRIGIGSLALMHYAGRVDIETTKRGSTSLTKAVISHPWALDTTRRTKNLEDFPAGKAWQVRRGASASDHYTIIRLCDVDDVLLGECVDVSSYYRLVDRLRRILPLKWEETELTRQLEETEPELVAVIQKHASAFSAHVLLRSRWSGDEILTRRVYGDGIAQDERWNGKPRPILKDVVVDDGKATRKLKIAGYLVSQVRPSPEWSGVTARVQNVAVEERTFFDLESDPGFRKYISGEVLLLGDLDRARLINIDRASFNRESADYRAVARAMQAELARFKAECVQAPQRAKVAVKRRLDQQLMVIRAAHELSAAVSSQAHDTPATFSFPSSHNGRIRAKRSRGLLDDLQSLGTIVILEPSNLSSTQPYRLRIASDGRRVVVEVDHHLVHPSVSLAGAFYALRFVEGHISDPPIIVKNRPREIVFNLTHEVFAGQIRQSAFEMVMALELAYLLGRGNTEEDLYDRALGLLAAR
jgi:hypothetical protein